MNKTLSYEELLLKTAFLEKEVKFNNFFLKKLFDVIPSPMFYKNISGVYEYCNDAFSNLILGLPQEEIIGKTLYELSQVIPKENADIYHEKDKELFITSKEQFYEGKVKCSDGVTRSYHFYKSSFEMDGKILGLVGLMLDVTNYKNALDELDKKNQQLNDLIIIDPLTGLYNRGYFQNILEKKVSLLNRHKQSFSFAILDIDFFKNYNDCYGHDKGDFVLEKIGKVLKESFNRPNDYVFRIGGEEFAILFTVEDFKDASLMIENLRNRISDLKIKSPENSSYDFLTVSIGLGNVKEIKSDTSPLDIYHEVDKLLYKSKNNERNQVTIQDIKF